MKVYVILSDYISTMDDKSTKREVFEGVCSTKDRAMRLLSDMIHVACIINSELVFYRVVDELAKKINGAIVSYVAHTDNTDQYIYIIECDLEEVD